MISPSFAVHVESVVHRYGERTALDSVGFDVAPGEIFGLLGPNGGGKTTLFRILATILLPSAGHAAIFGHDTREAPHEVRRLIGVVFQAPSLDKKLTVRENLIHHGHLYGMHGRALAQRIDELLEALGLMDRARERVEKLSGGLMRRVEIGKCLIPRPRLLLLDEPSTGLDPNARRNLRQQLETLRQQGVTCLLTTHLLDEADTCDRLAILDRGRLVALDSPGALKDGIRGDVVTVIANGSSEALRDEIQQSLGVEARLVGESIHLQDEHGHQLAGRLAQGFGERVSSIAVSRPTLDDVFVAHTGHRLLEE